MDNVYKEAALNSIDIIKTEYWEMMINDKADNINY